MTDMITASGISVTNNELCHTPIQCLPNSRSTDIKNDVSGPTPESVDGIVMRIQDITPGREQTTVGLETVISSGNSGQGGGGFIMQCSIYVFSRPVEKRPIKIVFNLNYCTVNLNPFLNFIK